MSYQNHLDDVCHILEILGLDSVLYEPVVRKYVREGVHLGESIPCR